MARATGGGSVHRVGSGPHVFPTCWANPWLVRCGCWILLLSILTGCEERLRSVSGSQFEAAFHMGPRGHMDFLYLSWSREWATLSSAVL